VTVQAKNIIEDQFAKKSRKHLNSVALRAYTVQKKSVRGEIENEQITELLPMVHKIASKVVTYLKPPLSFEDMISAGTVGLVRAARDFDPSYQAEFKTYAYIRIKGAILDEMRGWSFIPASLRKRIRTAGQLSRKITEQTGIAPNETELAERLGITVKELYETFENARAQHFISLDGFGEDAPLTNYLTPANPVSPEEKVERQELINKLAEAIQQLSERHRQVVLLYYQQQLTMKQVAEILEITESRVSQLHASALFNLSVKLRQWKDGRL